MPGRIVTDTLRVLEFVKTRVSVPAMEGMKAIGLERDGRLVAGVLYEGYNGQSVWTHIGAESGARWMTRRFLRYMFEYPFNELGVESIFGWVEARNECARRFDEKLGFKIEACLREAGPGGQDVLIYRMRRDQCRFI